MNYTPADASEFYEDAGIPSAATLAPLFQGNMTPSNTSPGTNFYGFYGSGMQSTARPKQNLFPCMSGALSLKPLLCLLVFA